MNHTRVKYNAKARRSTAGSGSKKKAKQPRTQDGDSNSKPLDPNAIIHIPRTKEEKEDDRKDRLRQEVCSEAFELLSCLCFLIDILQLIATSDSKMNSKRKKRLDKYIVSPRCSLRDLLSLSGSSCRRRSSETRSEPQYSRNCRMYPNVFGETNADVPQP